MGPFLVFAVLAAVWTFPLALHLSDRLPGTVAGDNLSFLWNLWWMRQVSATPGAGFFFTPLLFAPFGTDLSLHTHTALQAAIGATVLRGLTVVTAQNLIILATLTLNGYAAFLLALDRTTDTAGSLVAGVLFAGTSYVVAHLFGHFSLIGTWTLPLFALCLLRTLERESMVWSALTGTCLVAVAYTDYYYTVYCLVISAGLFFSGSGLARIELAPTQLAPRVLALLGAFVVLVLAGAAAVVLTGGFDDIVLGVRVRATDTHNLLVAVWLLVLVAAWLRLRPHMKVRLRDAWPVLAGRMRLLAPAVLVAVAGALPLLIHVVQLTRAGDYSAPTHFWRSGPRGVDLATLVLGSPFHPLTGAWSSTMYERLGLDRVEGVGWLGLVPTCALVWGAFTWRTEARVRRTLVGGCAFLVWALGPWLTVAGLDTGLMLPANLFGLVPLLSNARMPGRAIVVTVLAASLLSARIIAAASPRFKVPLATLAACLLLADGLPAPFPLIALDTPRIYRTLAAQGAGSVCELPMGLRDGFGQVGSFDDRTLQYQMVHGHPLVGGFAARIPPSILRGYQAMPVVRSLLRLSGGSQQAADPRDLSMSPAEIGSVLRADSIRFVVLDRSRATPALVSFIESRLPLTLLDRDGQRDLYLVGE